MSLSWVSSRYQANKPDHPAKGASPMSSELMKYSTGEVMPPRVERGVAKEAKKIYDRTRLAAFEVDAQVALAGHAMNKVAELDETRRQLAGNDPALNALLGDIELHAARNFKRTMDRASGGWGL
jgi:hypothetical protein